MEENQTLNDKIIKYSKEIGIDVIGFASIENFNKYPKQHQPDHFLKGSKTVILILNYLFDIYLDTWTQDKTSGKDFHFLDAILEKQCVLLKVFLRDLGYESRVISYSPGLFLKDAAALAGIGPIGKNNLLITEDYGPQIRLRAIVTNAALNSGKPILKSDYCINCNNCIKNCPANALSDGHYNKDKCLSYNNSNIKKLSEYSSLWCNICIEVCPIGKQAIK